MSLLAQFLLRLAFGLTVGMAITSSKQVTSGYFRNHLYVTLGLSTLAALVFTKISTTAAVLAATAAVLSFFGAAFWLYEARLPGKITLCLTAACVFAMSLFAQYQNTSAATNSFWTALATATSGLTLGLVFASMLLGHWYLNAPGMSLEPLKKLLIVSAMAIIAQGVVSALGTATAWSTQTEISSAWVLFIALRWSFGIVFVLALLWMSWRTLKIPNTQSATGILYVAVIGVFVGELTAALLSAQSAVPL